MLCCDCGQVRLYMDCEEYHRVAFDRTNRALEFGPSSGLFVGNAGGTGLPKFVVSQRQLLHFNSHNEHLSKTEVAQLTMDLENKHMNSNVNKMWFSDVSVESTIARRCCLKYMVCIQDQFKVTSSLVIGRRIKLIIFEQIIKEKNMAAGVDGKKSVSAV